MRGCVCVCVCVCVCRDLGHLVWDEEGARKVETSNVLICLIHFNS
jgi:hypothetical protein